jgi:hypothetical protein
LLLLLEGVSPVKQRLTSKPPECQAEEGKHLKAGSID